MTMEEQREIVSGAEAIWVALNLGSFQRKELSSLALALGTRIGQLVRDAGGDDPKKQEKTIAVMSKLYGIQIETAAYTCGLPKDGKISDMLMDEEELKEYNNGR